MRFIQDEDGKIGLNITHYQEKQIRKSLSNLLCTFTKQYPEMQGEAFFSSVAAICISAICLHMFQKENKSIEEARPLAFGVVRFVFDSLYDEAKNSGRLEEIKKELQENLKKSNSET